MFSNQSSTSSISGDLHLLAALCGALEDGPAIFIAPPNSPFSVLFDLHGGSTLDKIARSPASLVNNAAFSFGQYDLAALLSIQDNRSLAAGYDGFALAPRNRLIKCDRIDSSFVNLRSCSAIEICSEDVSSILEGSAELISRCRPVVIIHIPRSDRNKLDFMFDMFDKLGYIIIPESNIKASNLLAENSNIILALPVSAQRSEINWRGILFDRPGAIHSSSFAMHVARLRRMHLKDPFEGWEANVPAELMITDAKLKVRADDGTTLRWTGPRRDTRIQLFFPASGIYEVAIDVMASAAAEWQGPGCVLGGAAILRQASSTLGQRCLIADVRINHDEIYTGCTITLVAPDVAMRMIEGKWAKVGVAISAINLRRL